MRVRKSSLLLFAVALVVANGNAGEQAAPPRGPQTSGGKPPDILFIAIDDLNDWTTLFDPKNPIQTPNLQRLASRGTFFTRAYCASPGCNPSRTAIMTGLRPTTEGVYGNGDPWRKILPLAVTLPQYSATHGGNATRGAGKILHHGPTGAEDPNNHSFQQFFAKLPIRGPRSGKNYNGYYRIKTPLGDLAFDWGEAPSPADYAQPDRNQFHASSRRGWNNDPNGMV